MSSLSKYAVLEGLLFAAGDEGLSLQQLCSVMEIEESEARSLIEGLEAAYADMDRGIQIVALAGTYQLATKSELADYLKKLTDQAVSSSLSQAGLETLAIIAYRQPITRVEVEEIRGVKTERAIQTLLAKGLIQEAGRAEGTGRAKLYATTNEFLDYFGLNTIEDLPELPDGEEEGDGALNADLFFANIQEASK